MLSFRNLVLRRGPRVLLDSFSLSVHPGQRLGIVGRNGTGKSSLLALVKGELSPDEGAFDRPADWVIAHVRQETPALSQSALDYVLDGDVQWRRLNTAIEEAEAAGEGAEIARLHEQMQAIDGYTAPARAARLLHGLGFGKDQEHRPVSDFSGGWRMRLNLGQALMCRSDLLLLDEPTNHLDLDAVLWLQAWLAAYPGTLLLISHDRDFLDAVATHIVHLEAQQLRLYNGNYSSSERQRAEQLQQQEAQYVAAQRRAQHLQKFVDRFRAKATKARQAQSRLKQLEKMEINAPAHWDSPFRFQFAEPARLPSPLLKLNDLVVGYSGQAVLEKVKLTLEPGDRLALLGRNGQGKSTLMKSLAGELPVLAGESHRDKHLKLAYFAQHQVDSLDAQASAFSHLQRLDEKASEQALRDFLGGFDFHGDRVFEPVEPFSGGEKARLALALLVYQQPNVVLLDEPTNHLDLEMRHALELALQDFAGAVVVVSHDRHLISTCCDQLYLVDAGRCRPFDGDLDDYARHLRESARTASEPAEKDAREKLSAKDQRRSAADRRAKEKPWRDEVRRLEKDMEKTSAQLEKLRGQLGNPLLYSESPDKAADLAKQEGEAAKRLEDLEERWLTVQEELEALWD